MQPSTNKPVYQSLSVPHALDSKRETQEDNQLVSVN